MKETVVPHIDKAWCVDDSTGPLADSDSESQRAFIGTERFELHTGKTARRHCGGSCLCGWYVLSCSPADAILEALYGSTEL